MVRKLQNKSTYRFGYLAALYEGTAFVEVLNSVDTSGSGNYAAFQLEGKYYTTTNTGIINSGPIIYRILPVDIAQLDVTVTPRDKGFEPFVTVTSGDKGFEPFAHGKKKFAPLLPPLLDNIFKNAPPNIRQMIKPE